MQKYFFTTFIITLIFTNNYFQLKKTYLNYLNNQIFRVNCYISVLKTENNYLTRKKRIVKIKKQYSHFLNYQHNHFTL